jgi:quercetin dioxygenase-like cupin family protein
MTAKRIPGGLSQLLAAGFTLASALSLAVPAHADGAPPIVVSPSHFIKFSALPWLTVCEWTNAAGESHNSWTEGLKRPDAKTVPADALCTRVKRYNFAGGHNFLYAGFQKGRPTPAQTGKTTNFMYVLIGRGHSMVDGQASDTGPGDVLAQMADKPHQTVALTADYAQFDVVGIPTLADGQGFKMSESDTAHGNLIRHADAAKAADEVCLGNLTDGRYKRVERPIPAGTPCYMAFPLVTRPAARIVEVSTKKGAKSEPHKEGVDRVYYILKGKIKAVSGDDKATVGKGDTILHSTDTLHSEEYLEDTTFLEISYPKLDKAP